MLTIDLALCPCGCIGKRRRESFVQRTLNGGAGLVRQAIFSDDLSRRPGLLQQRDARVKVLAILAVLVVSAFLHTVPALGVLYLGTVVLAALSAVPLRFFLTRVWLTIPLFTGIVLIPATLSIVTSGDVVLTLWSWDGSPQGFTRQGLLSAALVVCRVACSMSLVLLLTVTTPWPTLLASLRALGVPRIFLLIVGMAYRYLFLLVGAVTEMYEARTARTTGPVKHDRGARRFVAATAGALLGRSMALSEDVHHAMVARGFRGEPVLLTAPRMRATDVAFGATLALSVVLLLVAEHVFVR